ncbi:membrane-spanning 4-domains subfamily A member 6A-like isoform X1 [Ursus arctos]|uniref:membrane-spanning 4-domains subfamily A member 6A-like isoform X1 n=2 Tax=Ursus arctos TaxID=9644 RepID=UPI0020173BB4|nr:membrane-spanning 4-domains subfamily A member 6A-like isoform X1 [Ursus arctos]XP_057166798.1 membrane-spanning 4-domains subfamily A member 6A-like isoform X1 [Ursus arctos]
MGKYWLPVWGALRALHFLRAEFIFSSSVGGTIISQPMANQTIVVLTPNGINFPQTETPKPTNQTQDSLEKRLKAEIKVLGTIQILCGAMVLSWGIILVSVPSSPQYTPMLSILLKAAYPFVGALSFVISGILSVIMEKKSTKLLARSGVAANILSSLCALMGFILLSVNLAALDPTFWNCTLNKEGKVPKGHHFFRFLWPYAKVNCSMAKTILAGTLSVMLICTVLEFCLALLAAAVWWKEAQSNFAGSVLFLPQSYKNKSTIPAKAFSDPGNEELLPA